MSARRVPIGVAVNLLRATLPVARTWRFRHPEEPRRRFAPRLGPEVYAAWHEHLLPLAWLCAHQDAATLASRDRDGEIVARLLQRLGYAVARGSSTRGGRAGFRELSRAAAAGHPVILTCDGPRGPRRVVKEGTPRLAAHSDRSVVPIGVAASCGWRLSSWDRFLIPAPGATIFVSLGPARQGGGAGAEALGEALSREILRCEVVAAEARWARAPALRRNGGVLGAGPAGEAPSAPGPDAPQGSGATRELPSGRHRSGGKIEARLRASWVRERPPALLVPASMAFSLVRDARARMYDAGVVASFEGGLPVLSVGGLTVGGSGKTPLASYLARRLVERGHQVAVLTRGYADELALHKRLCAEATVWGHPDRLRLARRAAAEGATVAVLDDGFQHRRLRRDLDVLAVDRDALRRTHRAALPAGPFREQWPQAARRAGAVVITGREPWGDEVASFDRALRAELSRVCPGLPVASALLTSAPPVPANLAAAAWAGAAAPRLALTGIMKPNLFFDQADGRCPSVTVQVALRDHGLPASGDRAALSDAAGRGGVLMTLKDLSRLEELFDPSVPIWVLPERLVWQGGLDGFREAFEDAAGAASADPARSAPPRASPNGPLPDPTRARLATDPTPSPETP